MRYMILIALLILPGCSSVSPLAGSSGIKTTTEYDPDGHVVRQTQEEKPLLDSQTAYQETIQEISRNHSKAVQATASGLKEAMTALAADKKLSEGAKAIMLYRGFESFEALGKYANIDPATLAAVQRSMSGYEVTASLGKAIIGGGMWAYLGHAAASTLQGFADAAGDRTSIDVGGDGNAVSVDKRELHNEIHANTTGDNSSPIVTTNPSTGCESGNCDGDEEELPPGVPPKPESCGDDGYWSGTNWQLTPTCSCESHAEGRC